MLPLYFIALRFYAAGIFIASFFNSKAKAWIDGRRNIFSHIQSQLGANEKRFWFHCSSFGEFEQGRPVIQALKKKYPQHKIVLTFFSPSGISQGKKERAADYIFYMPLDGYAASKKFIELINPAAAFFVKYDYWFGYMNQLSKKQIPFYYVSAIFRTEHYFFKWYGTWFLNQLKKATCFCVQDDNSQKLLHQHNINQVKVTDDTRFDRVFEFSKNVPPLKVIEDFKQQKKLIVAGSTWSEDEKLLAQYINQSGNDAKFIIVPHEIKEGQISTLQLLLKKKSFRYSQIKADKIADDADVIIVDAIGVLSKLYQYADVAYIGGGFGKGIHNILEAVVFGVPVVFGSNYHKFKEAVDLVQLNGAFPVTDFASLQTKLDFLLSNNAEYKEIKEKNKKFVQERTGATEKILQNVSL